MTRLLAIGDSYYHNLDDIAAIDINDREVTIHTNSYSKLTLTCSEEEITKLKDDLSQLHLHNW